MGRPSEQNERSEQGKAGTSLWILLIGIVSLVLSIVAVAIPYWGNFSLATGGGTGFSSRSRDGDGYFGPFQVCRYSYGSAYASACDSDVRGEGQRGPGGFEKQVFIVIGGICAIVEVVALGLFTICAGLHCAMLINNKHIWLKYKRNIFLAVISAAIAVLAAVGASVLGGIEISSKKAQYEVTIGAALVLEIILIFLNTGLLALSYRAYRKSKKAIFPRPHAPYEISGDRYEPSSHAGIAVTGTSGDLYPNQQAPPIHLTTSALPQYPAPASTQYLPASSQQQYPSNTNGNVFQGAYINGGQINNAYNGTLPQYAQPAYNLTGQLAQPQMAKSVPKNLDGARRNPPFLKKNIFPGISSSPTQNKFNSPVSLPNITKNSNQEKPSVLTTQPRLQAELNDQYSSSERSINIDIFQPAPPAPIPESQPGKIFYSSQYNMSAKNTTIGNSIKPISTNETQYPSGQAILLNAFLDRQSVISTKNPEKFEENPEIIRLERELMPPKPSIPIYKSNQPNLSEQKFLQSNTQEESLIQKIIFPDYHSMPEPYKQMENFERKSSLKKKTEGFDNPTFSSENFSNESLPIQTDSVTYVYHENRRSTHPNFEKAHVKFNQQVRVAEPLLNKVNPKAHSIMSKEPQKSINEPEMPKEVATREVGRRSSEKPSFFRLDSKNTSKKGADFNKSPASPIKQPPTSLTLHLNNKKEKHLIKKERTPSKEKVSPAEVSAMKKEASMRMNYSSKAKAGDKVSKAKNSKTEKHEPSNMMQQGNNAVLQRTSEKNTKENINFRAGFSKRKQTSSETSLDTSGELSPDIVSSNPNIMYDTGFSDFKTSNSEMSTSDLSPGYDRPGVQKTEQFTFFNFKSRKPSLRKERTRKLVQESDSNVEQSLESLGKENNLKSDKKFTKNGKPEKENSSKRLESQVLPGNNMHQPLQIQSIFKFGGNPEKRDSEGPAFFKFSGDQKKGSLTVKTRSLRKKSSVKNKPIDAQKTKRSPTVLKNATSCESTDLSETDLKANSFSNKDQPCKVYLHPSPSKPGLYHDLSQSSDGLSFDLDQIKTSTPDVSASFTEKFSPVSKLGQTSPIISVDDEKTAPFSFFKLQTGKSEMMSPSDQKTEFFFFKSKESASRKAEANSEVGKDNEASKTAEVESNLNKGFTKETKLEKPTSFFKFTSKQEKGVEKQEKKQEKGVEKQEKKQEKGVEKIKPPKSSVSEKITEPKITKKEAKKEKKQTEKEAQNLANKSNKPEPGPLSSNITNHREVSMVQAKPPILKKNIEHNEVEPPSEPISADLDPETEGKMKWSLFSGWGSKSQTKQIDEAQEMSVESPTKRLKIDKRSSSLPVGQGWAELASSTEHVPIQYMQPRQAYSTQPSVEIRRPSTLSQRSICDETDPSKLKPPSINHHRQSKKRKSSVGSHKVQSRPSIPSGVSMGVNLNPEGRVSYNPLKGPGHGSMDSLNSTQSLTNSLGSTGSFSSNISNPIRSSMKKPKNKDNPSVASGLSKKSVTIAIGAEQTAV